MRKVAAVALLLVFASIPARADGWRFENGIAGYAGDDGDFNGLWLDCAGAGAARLSVSTGGTRLQAGIDQTVVITVDGIAFLQPMRANAGERRPSLQRTLGANDARALAGALARGSKAEIAMPAGRFALPLKGSGKALQTFAAACR